MASFYMLAGTVLSDLDMQQMMSFLSQQGLQCRMEDEELRIDGAARIYVRPGFDHEFILVGDAREEIDLRRDCEQLSAVLRSQRIQHAYELYGRDNEAIAEYEFTP